MNRRSRLVYVNRAASQLLGYTKDELLNLSLSNVEANHDRTVFEGLFRPTTGRIAPFETVYLKKDQTPIPVEVSVAPLEYGQDLYLFCVARDISERKAVEASLRNHAEELSRSNRELEQFAYISSHDLKEPLRMVTVYVQMLQNTLEGKLDAQTKAYLDFAVEGSRRMRDLINDLLAYSRVSKEFGAFTDVVTNELVDIALQNLKTSIEESGAKVEVDPLPPIQANSSQIVQLFQNILANAIKFRPPGSKPRIRISARESDDKWIFSVKDNGIGISNQYLNRIFVIFQRLHTSQKYPGTGIGLSICKKIVENHGGSIWAESELGKGSTFYFALPKGGEVRLLPKTGVKHAPLALAYKHADH